MTDTRQATVSSFKFKCPRCGGFRYGSSMHQHNELGDEQPVAQWHRGCNGYLPSPTGIVRCGFTWLDTDDWKHFVDELDRPFHSREVFDRAEAQELQDTPVTRASS